MPTAFIPTVAERERILSASGAKAFGVIDDIVADRHGTIHTDSGDGEGRLVV